MNADNRTRKALNWEEIEKRLASYGAMAVAVAVAGVSPAEAGIIYTNPADATTPINGIIAFNLETGAVLTGSSAGMQFVLRNSSATALTFSGSLVETFRTAAVDQGPVGNGEVQFSSSFVARLNFGSAIGPAGDFAAGGVLANLAGNTYGNWAGGGQDYLGLRFIIGGNTHYGWANLTLNSDFTVTLANFAYEGCAGEGIAAGATSGGAGCVGAEVPEPHSAILLALGAAGLLTYRRRRKTA